MAFAAPRPPEADPVAVPAAPPTHGLRAPPPPLPTSAVAARAISARIPSAQPSSDHVLGGFVPYTRVDSERLRTGWVPEAEVEKKIRVYKRRLHDQQATFHEQYQLQEDTVAKLRVELDELLAMLRDTKDSSAQEIRRVENHCEAILGQESLIHAESLGAAVEETLRDAHRRNQVEMRAEIEVGQAEAAARAQAIHALKSTEMRLRDEGREVSSLRLFADAEKQREGAAQKQMAIFEEQIAAEVARAVFEGSEARSQRLFAEIECEKVASMEELEIQSHNLHAETEYHKVKEAEEQIAILEARNALEGARAAFEGREAQSQKLLFEAECQKVQEAGEQQAIAEEQQAEEAARVAFEMRESQYVNLNAAEKKIAILEERIVDEGARAALETECAREHVDHLAAASSLENDLQRQCENECVKFQSYEHEARQRLAAARSEMADAKRRTKVAAEQAELLSEELEFARRVEKDLGQHRRVLRSEEEAASLSAHRTAEAYREAQEADQRAQLASERAAQLAGELVVESRAVEEADLYRQLAQSKEEEAVVFAADRSLLALREAIEADKRTDLATERATILGDEIVALQRAADELREELVPHKGCVEDAKHMQLTLIETEECATAAGRRAECLVDEVHATKNLEEGVARRAQLEISQQRQEAIAARMEAQDAEKRARIAASDSQLLASELIDSQNMAKELQQTCSAMQSTAAAAERAIDEHQKSSRNHAATLNEALGLAKKFEEDVQRLRAMLQKQEEATAMAVRDADGVRHEYFELDRNSSTKGEHAAVLRDHLLQNIGQCALQQELEERMVNAGRKLEAAEWAERNAKELAQQEVTRAEEHATVAGARVAVLGQEIENCQMMLARQAEREKNLVARSASSTEVAEAAATERSVELARVTEQLHATELELGNAENRQGIAAATSEAAMERMEAELQAETASCRWLRDKLLEAAESCTALEEQIDDASSSDEEHG